MKLCLAHLVSYLPRKLVAPYPGVHAMAYNPIQFQQGMSLPEFLQSFGTETDCAALAGQAASSAHAAT